MNTQEAKQVLIDYNKWRRGADVYQPQPANIGAAINCAIECMAENKLMFESIGDYESTVGGTVNEAFKQGFDMGRLKMPVIEEVKK